MKPQTILNMIVGNPYLACKVTEAYNEDIGEAATLLAMEPIEVIENVLGRRIRKQPKMFSEKLYDQKVTMPVRCVQGSQMVLEGQRTN